MAFGAVDEPLASCMMVNFQVIGFQKQQLVRNFGIAEKFVFMIFVYIYFLS